MARLTKLRSKRSFDRFIDQEKCVVIVHHYLCLGCQTYRKDITESLDLFNGVGVASMHMTTNRIIDKESLNGDVEEENLFLGERYGAGDDFPATLFFSNGKMKRRVDGPLTPQELLNLIDETF